MPVESYGIWHPAGHVCLVSLLLNYYAGLDLERRDQRGLTALMKAAMRNRSDCVAALLMAGARSPGALSAITQLQRGKGRLRVSEINPG